MAKYTNASLVLFLIVMTIMNGSDAARRGLIMDKNLEDFRFCKDFKLYMCLWNSFLCYWCIS